MHPQIISFTYFSRLTVILCVEIILNIIFNIINSERYLATHHCYPSDKMLRDLTKTFYDNDIVYNYPFSLMSIYTRHSMSHLSSSILDPYTFLQLCRRIKFHLVTHVPHHDSRSTHQPTFNHPITENVCKEPKYLTPTSRVHSGFRSKGGIHNLSL